MDGSKKESGDPVPEDYAEDDIIRDVDVDLEDDEDELNAEGDTEGAAGEEDMPVEDNAVVVFSGHTEKPHATDELPEVYAVHVDPSPNNTGLVITGGRDDSAYVWVMNSGQVVFECIGHKNSVTCVGFSHDGMYAASADLDGLIKVWKCSTKQEVWSYECGSDIIWLQWHPVAHVLLAGTQGGEVWMWQVPSQDWSKMKMFQSHGHPSLCGKVLPNGKYACVGYSDGVVKLWDLKTGTAVHVWQHSTAPEEQMPEDDSDEEEGEGQAEAEERPEDPVAILCVDCSADNHLVMSGCADSTVKIYNVSSGKLVSAFNCAVNADQDNSVESVAFCPVAPYAATSTNSGSVEIWDLPTSVVRHSLQHPEGVSRVKWASSAPLLFTGCLDGIMRLWDARSGTTKAVLSGHSRHSCILDFDVTSDGTCLVSASEDGTARVFDLRFTQS